MSEKKKKGPEAVVREIKRNTRRKFISEEKIRIVLEGGKKRLSGTPKEKQPQMKSMDLRVMVKGLDISLPSALVV